MSAIQLHSESTRFLKIEKSFKIFRWIEAKLITEVNQEQQINLRAKTVEMSSISITSLHNCQTTMTKIATSTQKPYNIFHLIPMHTMYDRRTWRTDLSVSVHFICIRHDQVVHVLIECFRSNVDKNKCQNGRITLETKENYINSPV